MTAPQLEVPRFLVAFWVLSLVANVCYPVVWGPYWGIWPVRYFLPLLVLPVPLLAVVAASRASSRSERLTRWVAAAVVTVAGATALPAALGIGWSALSLPYPRHVRLLDDLARSRGVRFGYAGYWEARFVTQLSRSGLELVQVDPDLSASTHTVDLCSYQRAPSVSSERLFILEENLDPSRIVEVCGEPDQTFRLDGTVVLEFRRASCDPLVRDLAAWGG